MWPRTTYAIYRNNILPDATNGDNEDMEIDNANAEGDEDLFEPIPEQENFTCLCNVNSLQVAFNIPGTRVSNIVILKEYDWLRQLLEKSDRPFIVTGHPGTGS